MTIVVRTNCNGTLGHLARMHHLSGALGALGHDVRLLLDHARPALATGRRLEGEHEGLYADDGDRFADEAEDARRCLAAFAPLGPDLVIVDDYRLGLEWERCVGDAGYRVMAVDDLMREHRAEILLEPGRLLAHDPRSHASSCVLLQGPDHVLLDPAYARPARERSPDPTGERSPAPEVILSLGGGGDLALLTRLMAELLALPVEGRGEEQGDATLSRPLLKPVIGPRARNAAAVLELAAAHPDIIRPIVDAPNLAAHFDASDLFVGAAGTSVYETAARRLPAITFAIARNQVNGVADLERLGHYLHVNDFDDEDCPALARLVSRVLGRLPRLRALRETAQVTIDAAGTGRVASIVDKAIRPRRAETTATSIKAHADATPAPSRDPVDEAPPLAPFRVVPCDDRDINRYLDARNLEANRANMTTVAPIERLAHYRWWFGTERRSYRVECDGTPALYIWHDIVSRLPAGPVLVGGWFVCRDLPGMSAVMAALDWQLAHTDAAHPELPWVAIIKRENRFVSQLNRRAGFLEAPSGTPAHDAVRACFPDADPDGFHHVYRPARLASADPGDPFPVGAPMNAALIR